MTAVGRVQETRARSVRTHGAGRWPACWEHRPLQHGTQLGPALRRCRLCHGARTGVDAQQGVDELLGGALGAVAGCHGHQAVPGPAGRQLLLRDGACGGGDRRREDTGDWMGLGTRGTGGPGAEEPAEPPSPASACPRSRDVACGTESLRTRPLGHGGGVCPVLIQARHRCPMSVTR